MIYLAIAAPFLALAFAGLYGAFEYAKIARDQRHETARENHQQSPEPSFRRVAG